MTEKRKTKGESPATSPNGLPETLAALKMLAEDQQLPPLTEEIAAVCPTLWEMLCPRWVGTGRSDGNGKAVRAWEEPILTVAWSAAAGRYTWSLTLRALNVRVQGFVTQLPQLVVEIEMALLDRKVTTKPIKHVDRER